jgi:hypothetical protein
VSARPLPVTLEAIDAAWLSRALGVPVRESEIVDVIRGTCTKVRLRLHTESAAVPETLILKGGFEPHSREHTFLLQVEPWGYRDLLPSAGLNTPACYFADYDEESRQGIVIMEDLARRAPCSAIR